MQRRTFVGMAAASAASPVFQRVADAQPASGARNVVLVHGLFADGSCWSEVIARLQPKGLQVTSVQNPLTTLPAGVEAAQRALALQPGPTVLVGHSFSGMIVTEAGIDPKVSALVYVAAARARCRRGLHDACKALSNAAGLGRNCLVRRLGQAERGGFPARLRRRPACGQGSRSLRRSGAIRANIAGRQDDTRGMAFQAKLVCRLHGRPDNQS